MLATAMASQATRCPVNSFSSNGTQCVCDPGYLMNSAGSICTLFRTTPDEWILSSGIEYSLKFPATLVSFESISRITNSQAIMLEATFILVLTWLLFCAAMRFARMNDGESIYFKIRWWISRLDFSYANVHWLEDQNLVKKRKTELGGAFSFASWIMFIGLITTLIYQTISKRSLEVHNVKPANAPDLESFLNDLELNITTISSMTCSNLRGLDRLSENSRYIDYNVSFSTNFANYSCHNTTKGPTIALKCYGCRILNDGFISWYFVDIPSSPAAAVAFQFNLSSRSHGNHKHVSFISGTLRNGSAAIEKPFTFRGPDVNILEFHFFPRIYRNFHDLRLVQPLFHEFIPGSNVFTRSELQSSIRNPTDGVVNTTVHMKFLSDFIIEIYGQHILGPVGFFANVGGLYAFCIAAFFYFLTLFECRIKNLHYEDKVMQDIRRRKRAQLHWDKLRKYVIYTWCPKRLRDEPNRSISSNLMKDSLQKRRHDSVCLAKEPTNASQMNIVFKDACIKERNLLKNDTNANYAEQCEGSSRLLEACKPSQFSVKNVIGHLPTLSELEGSPESKVLYLQKCLLELHDCNFQLRERLAKVEILLEHLNKLDSVYQKDTQPGG